MVLKLPKNEKSFVLAATAKAHIRQSILSSEEAMKIVTERHELEELRSLLQKVHDRLSVMCTNVYQLSASCTCWSECIIAAC